MAEFAELLGAGVAKALLGKEELPYDLPYVTGAIGLLHTEPSWQLMQDCDILFMIGTSFPWVKFLWADGKVKAASLLSLRCLCDVNLHGYAKGPIVALVGDEANADGQHG